MTDFGKRLVAVRQARGLTQVQLAEATGLTQRVVSRLETVADYPTVPVLMELCRALRVSADELLGLKPHPRWKRRASRQRRNASGATSALSLSCLSATSALSSASSPQLQGRGLNLLIPVSPVSRPTPI